MDKLNNDFYNALDYERSMFGKTDIFYEKWIKNILYASYPWNLMEINLSRWDWNTPEGRTKQMSDIDITIDVDVKSGQIKNHYNISEKFRTDDYGDMFIELYSKYPNVKGWGPTTEADLIFYHTPKNLYYIDAKDIKSVSNDIMNTIFAFTLTTETKYYEEGDLIFDTSGSDIGRVLRCHRVAVDEIKIFYSYDVESNVNTFKRLQAKEIELYKIPKYSVYPCNIVYTIDQ